MPQPKSGRMMRSPRAVARMIQMAWLILSSESAVWTRPRPPGTTGNAQPVPRKSTSRRVWSRRFMMLVDVHHGALDGHCGGGVDVHRRARFHGHSALGLDFYISLRRNIDAHRLQLHAPLAGKSDAVVGRRDGEAVLPGLIDHLDLLAS